MAIRVFLLVALAASGSCAARTAAPVGAAPAGSPSAAHENLNAVVWMQTALEYEATATQAFRLAALQMDTALKEPSWTAALEQTGDFSKLPPAVIVDIDETVLDNSYYQARMIRDNTTFGAQTWDPWVLEARATPIPGALEFVRHAASRRVVIFYISNRTANLEEATRKNLAALGFPLADGIDTILTRGERPEWQPSDKGPRRAHVAKDYRILLSIGDDLGDFVPDASGAPDDRRKRTAAQAEWWGRRWIMIPNPTYGSWERAVIGSADNPNAARRRALRFDP